MGGARGRGAEAKNVTDVTDVTDVTGVTDVTVATESRSWRAVLTARISDGAFVACPSLSNETQLSSAAYPESIFSHILLISGLPRTEA
jgi:hypothetical protein